MLLKDIAIFNPKSDLLKKFNFINYIDTSSVCDNKLLSIQELESDYPSRAQRIISKNDILISSVRPILRHNYYVSKEIKNGVASTGFIHIRVNSNSFLPLFVYYYLTSENKVMMYNDIAETSQSTFPSFNKEVIENYQIPDISLPEQQHIVNTNSRKTRF